MKKLKWNYLSFAIAAAIVMTGGNTSASAEEGRFSIQVDGKSIPTAYVNQSDRLMVPAVFFSRFGAMVDWDERKQAVLLKDANTRLMLPSGENTVYQWNDLKWVADTVSTTTMDRQNGTYIPLRYAAEKLGWKVSFHQPTGTIAIDTNNETAENIKKDDRYWLCQITEAEAGGESYQGKLAVAASILNRVKSPDYPNTIKDVIFQVSQKNGVNYYQFSPVKDQRIYSVTPSQDTVRAVHEALQGKDPTFGSVVFYNPDKTANQWVRNQTTKAIIGNHVFAG